MAEMKKQDSLDESKKIVHTYPLLRHTDMPEEIKTETMELIVGSCEKHPSNNEQDEPGTSDQPTEKELKEKKNKAISKENEGKCSASGNANRRSKKDDISNFIVGSCLLMCPLDEITFRQREKLIHRLEMSRNAEGKFTNRANRQLMVKKFVRSAAGCKILPGTVRPVPVLCNTLCYLLSVCDREELPWWDVYDFVHDRIRAVKQDLVVQGVAGSPVLPMLLAIIKFYTYAQYRLCKQDLSEFNPHLNLQHLAETLKTALEICKESDYDQKDKQPNRVESTVPVCQQEYLMSSDKEDGTDDDDDDDDDDNVADETSELEASEIIESLEGLSLDSSRQEKHSPHSLSEEDKERIELEVLNLLVHLNDEKTLQHTMNLPSKIRHSTLMKKVMNASSQWLLGNYTPLCKLFKSLAPLHACALHHHLGAIQRQALGMMSRAYNSKVLIYSIEDLKNTLMFPSVESAYTAIKYYGLENTDKGVIFNKATFNWDIDVVQSDKLLWLDEKLCKIAVSKLLTPKSLHSSFRSRHC